MIIVGLTGGIGSGKTTVAEQFRLLGIPVYIADVEAKKLMVNSKAIRRKLIALFGDNAYYNGELNKTYLAGIIFKDKAYLNKMNAIVHPKVGRHFMNWAAKQNAPYVIKEAAIIFENNTHKQYDFIITVVAPKEIKIQRLLKRDTTTTDKIESIMKNQWDDMDKIKLSNFVIENVGLEETKKQVLRIHNQILENLGKS